MAGTPTNYDTILEMSSLSPEDDYDGNIIDITDRLKAKRNKDKKPQTDEEILLEHFNRLYALLG